MATVDPKASKHGIDFQSEFGVNAGYAESLYGTWLEAPDSVEPEWRAVFEKLHGAVKPAAAEPALESDAEHDLEVLRGISARIAENMAASLEVPTATTVRTLPVKVLAENRRTLNRHMKVRALGKASYTHIIAFALVRALRELPQLQCFYEVRDGKPCKLTPKDVNFGIAIDVETSSGRSLMVPNIRGADRMGFKEFHTAYEDVVARARKGKLTADDFKGTTASLTNPGGFGTHMSVPRLMKGQGLIIAVGSIGVPTEAASMAPGTLADLALGPVMTATSTYDHRVIQGAESGLLLKRLEELLQGDDGFYDEIFAAMRVPWTPALPAPDRAASLEEAAREQREKQATLWMLINAYRVRGHRLADLDPLAYKPDLLPSLDPGFYGFTIWDLDREFLTGGMCGQSVATLRDILDVLRDSYCRRWTIEYMHIADRVRKHWIRERIEPRRNEDPFGHEERVRTLRRLTLAENFEQFLHTRYVGNKRFSLEGAEAMVPALAEIIDRAAEDGVEKVVMGMAHRGRLNVLANILGKSYEQVVREFEAVLLPLSTEGSGDVKYHLGQRGVYTTPSGKKVEVVLAANPSHLEAVDPVVCGMVRSYQDEMGDEQRKKVLSVLVHGDAAFSGQGVVAETLNMSELPAYRCGGTVHLILNNQIGFTAGPKDLRSTYYCSDLAKGIEAPVLHANGDYPESVLKATHAAIDYQREFGRDVVIDMVCYRRWGHNEGDEPAFTQPVLYRNIKNHPTVVANYIDLLVRRGAMSREECDAIGQACDDQLKAALEASRAEPAGELPIEDIIDLTVDDPRDYCDEASPETAVPEGRLVELVDRLNEVPAGHTTHPNLLRQLRRREDMVRGEKALDWGCAEALAFGSLLTDGVPIRLLGQDSGRGTFSQRHAVIRDQVSELDYVPLDDLEGGASFEVHDSLLSEEAALGFEYGYALGRPEAMVLWEAQFGDFVNGAQVQIDQFIAPGEAKWKQIGGVTLLLPHGFDGQGPEHSSGRMERFLLLCADGNMTIANCSTSAQYFHLLRRQGGAQPKRPLVIFTPKSLLRDKRAASAVGALATGGFREVIDDADADPDRVNRVVFCSGKVYYDLVDARTENDQSDVAIVRVEQLYPFPRAAVKEILGKYSGAELVWCQEEPRNMGGWHEMLQRFHDMQLEVRYVGRPTAASPATGSFKRHTAEQAHLVAAALEIS